MNVKNLILLKKPVACIFVLTFTLLSCSKNNSTTSSGSTAPTQADAADALSSSLVSGSGGYADQLNESASFASAGNTGKGEGLGLLQRLTCGVPFDTTYEHSYSGVSGRTATITHQWEMLLTCNGLQPSTLTFTGTFAGTYDGPNLSASIEGNRNWTISGLEKANSDLTYNGSFESAGTNTFKVRNKNTFTRDIRIVSTDVLVDKSTHLIVSGSATVNIDCTNSGGKTYSFSGTLVFNGDQTATLNFNGNFFTIHL